VKKENRNERTNKPGSIKQSSFKKVPENGNIVLGSPTNGSIVASVMLKVDWEGFIEFSTESGR
jgi:hypothetical protein